MSAVPPQKFLDNHALPSSVRCPAVNCLLAVFNLHCPQHLHPAVTAPCDQLRRLQCSCGSALVPLYGTREPALPSCQTPPEPHTFPGLSPPSLSHLLGVVAQLVSVHGCSVALVEVTLSKRSGGVIGDEVKVTPCTCDVEAHHTSIGTGSGSGTHAVVLDRKKHHV
jgi:hypothetical protein